MPIWDHCLKKNENGDAIGSHIEGKYGFLSVLGKEAIFAAITACLLFHQTSNSVAADPQNKIAQAPKHGTSSTSASSKNNGVEASAANDWRKQISLCQFYAQTRSEQSGRSRTTIPADFKKATQYAVAALQLALKATSSIERNVAFQEISPQFSLLISHYESKKDWSMGEYLLTWQSEMDKQSKDHYHSLAGDYQRLSKFCVMDGKTQDAEKYSKLAEDITERPRRELEAKQKAQQKETEERIKKRQAKSKSDFDAPFRALRDSAKASRQNNGAPSSTSQ